MTQAPDPPHPNAIAIVGMACRLPGAANPAEFWANLCAGVESITRFTPAELQDSFDAQTRARPNYVAARPVLADADLFDAGYFGMYPAEAALTDPQQRLFLECAAEALDEAGHDPGRPPGPVGVFAGASMNTYFLQQVCADRAAIEDFTSQFQVGAYPTLLGNGDFIATRTAYKLDLRGPALSVQTACSTSLVAIAQACQSLLLFQCDMALAGGASISFPQRRGYVHLEGGIASADGHCRPFDAAASGTVFGSGVGVVLLRRLEDALADGDAIHAVIRGAALNNDGAGKVGFTAPSVAGQVAVLEAAQAMAEVAPASISFVECHGTGTPLGDPIEVAALTQVFAAGEARPARCALGSVKSNIGHLDAAAGVAGLIKTVLALEHRQIPATLHFITANPRLGLEDGPFSVPAALTEWAGPLPLRAGVSALGVGGTNAHVVVEQVPEQGPSGPGAPVQLLVLSARSEAALQRMADNLAARLAATPALNLADVAYTLQLGRRVFAHRRAVVAASLDAAAAALGTPACHTAGAPPPVALLFPGQGAQHAGMARGLYDTMPVFRDAIDVCAAHLQPLLGQDLRVALFAEPGSTASAALLATMLAQPALFTVEYALAALWQHWGVVPAAMIGHSVGEFVAACRAGVMTLADALGLIAARGRLMQDQPAGAMLSVRLAEAELAPLLAPGSAIAAVNAPSLCVAAGPHDEIAALEATLAAREIPHRRLHTSHAFHSPMMDAALPALGARAAAIQLNPPAMPFVSTVTGTWITPAQATDPAYWARQCRAPVRFAAAVQTLVADMPGLILLEAGPGRALSTLARQGAARGNTVLACLGDADSDTHDLHAMLTAAGTLWTAGLPLDWRAMHAPHARRRVRLPTYPFERERHWIDAPSRAAPLAAAPIAAAPIAAAPLPPSPAPDPSPMSDSLPAAGESRVLRLQGQITALLEKLSGESLTGADPALSFVELGFDSLFLGQFAQALGRSMGLTVAFRDLLGGLPSVAALAAHADSVLPDDAAPPVVAPAAAVPAAAAMPSTGGSSVEGLMAAQLHAMQALFGQQLAALQSMGQAPPAAASAAAPAAAPAALAPVPAAGPAPSVDLPEPKSRFAVYKPTTQAAAALSAAQQHHVDTLIASYTARTHGSRDYTQAHRARLADPRAAAGFRAEWKDMVYPIVSARAAGARLWDIDDNEYIDLVNGYGQTFLGHAPPMVVEAVAAQLRDGFAIGPQSPLAGEVADLVCELTGHDRATFCNTGSEAVMAALRVARTVTGRDRVVVFGGAYHGQFDEVLVKGARSGPPRALPIAPGIPADAVANMVVLPYTEDSVAWVRANAAELAAVVVEPVQSRHPAFQPRAMLAELRGITEQAGAALVFDEVVTGFRMHPGGMQALFDIRADLATYGKVLGGGMPIGVLAGTRRFMDALDGGTWDYGDDSYPAVAPTFFAGTFVRHPLTLAAARAVLLYLRDQGPALQAELATRTEGLVARLTDLFTARGVVPSLEQCSSLFYLSFHDGQRLGSLLWYHLRARGIYVQEGFPCFLTTAHGQAEIDAIVVAFADSLDAMLEDGALERTATPAVPFAVAPTEPQTEIWLAAQFGAEASCAFNEGLRITLDGPLDRPALTAALNQVIARHDALRAAFSPTGERMIVLPALSLMLEDADDEPLDRVLAEEARTPFDLQEGPLIRARLLRTGPERHVLVLTAHHIVCDGWSFNVIVSEVTALYAAACKGAAAALPEPLAFSRYATGPYVGEDQAALDWWQGQFAEPPAPLDLPTDRPRPARKSYRGATFTTTVDAALATAVRKAGGRQGCTLFATLLSALDVLLGRLGDARDITVASPAAGQSAVGDDTLVGHCVNLLPLRAVWQADTTLAGLMRTVQHGVLAAYDHQACTLGTIVRRLGLPRVPGRVPLTDVQFNLERLAEAPAMAGLAVTIEPNPKAFVNFDLFINAIESAQGLRLDIDYSTDLFDAATIARWMEHFRAILTAIATDPDQPVGRVQLGPRAAPAPAPAPAPAAAPAAGVDALIAAACARDPGAVALRGGGEQLSYAELQTRVDRLARALVQRAPAGSRVGVLLRRSPALPIALLAVMRAGLAYVPLDPSHPPARLRAILEHAGAASLLTDRDAADPLIAAACPPGTTVLSLAGLEAGLAEPATLPPPDAARPAYVIYTSGSTGAPKGVEIPHRALANLLGAMAERPGLAAGDRLLAVTTVAFDIAALELFLPLTVGATCVIAGAEEGRDGFALMRLLGEHAITTLQATPSLWRILLEAGFRSTPGLRMLAGGEALDRALANRLTEGGGSLWNMYGPTETTIWSTVDEVLPGDGPITVGRPIARTTLHVLDAEDQPRPVGVAGALCIGGAGLAVGYVGAPELTAQAFAAVSIGGAAPERVYRTGDLARLLPDGRMQLLGRTDSQIKLRGFRIELGEIEAVLARVDGVAAAAVALRSELGGGQLAGYYVAQAGAAVGAADITRALAAQLPDYMIPALWVRLDAMPMTANGKLDRRALPAPGAPTDRNAPPPVAPRTPLEQRIADIWRTVLGVEQFGVEDTLFALGADSIHIFRIAARLMQDGIGLSARDLLDHPTIAEQARQAEHAPARSRPSLSDYVRARRATAAA